MEWNYFTTHWGSASFVWLLCCYVSYIRIYASLYPSFIYIYSLHDINGYYIVLFFFFFLIILICTYYARKVCVNVICNHAAFFPYFLYMGNRGRIINKIFFHQKNNHELIRLFTWNRWDLHQFIFLLFFVRTIGWEGKRILFFYKQKVTRRSRKMGYL